MKIRVLTVIFFIFSHVQTGNATPQDDQTRQPAADWTVFVFVQSKCDLHPFSIKNIQDMASVGSNERVNIIVQWEEIYKNGTWRYKINKDNIQLVDSNATDVNIDCVKTLVEGARFAFTKFPAKHTAIVFWGHGSGIGDPQAWWNHMLRNYPCRDSEESMEELLDVLKGILFNFEHKVYMTNQQLVVALDQITREVLYGNPIDVVGMDSCLMAMYEMAYQIRKHARYFVGSQQVEHAFGWPYAPIVSSLCSAPLTPLQFSQSIVHNFGEFYRHKIPWYTQSAIDLSHVDALKNSIDAIVNDINACKSRDPHTIKKLVSLARQSSLQFNVPSYIDLYSFFNELHLRLELLSKKSIAFEEGAIQFKALSSDDIEQFVDRRPSAAATSAPVIPLINAVIDAPEYDQLKAHLQQGMNAIHSTVVANVAGSSMNHAKGISIYFPKNPHYIDSSYPKTQFAQSSSWLTFLHTIE